MQFQSAACVCVPADDRSCIPLKKKKKRYLHMCGFGQFVVLFIVRVVEGRGVVDGDVFPV